MNPNSKQYSGELQNTLTKKSKTVSPKIFIDHEIIEEAIRESQVEKQVIVHCSFTDPKSNLTIQICKTTYLRDQDSSHKSKLITAHNITVEPTWQDLPVGKAARFTLVFSALPRSCKSFDLFEDTDGGGFYTKVTPRNKTDVYLMEIFAFD